MIGLGSDKNWDNRSARNSDYQCYSTIHIVYNNSNLDNNIENNIENNIIKSCQISKTLITDWLAESPNVSKRCKHIYKELSGSPVNTEKGKIAFISLPRAYYLCQCRISHIAKVVLMSVLELDSSRCWVY